MKKAIIIGASSGIGQEVARLLINEGWRVGVAARREERLLALKSMAPERIEVSTIDVTQPDATQRLRELIDRVGGMDLYFHASGIGKQNLALASDIELQTVETNALGFTRMTGEAYRYFAEKLARDDNNGEAHIAVISSIAGTKGLGPAPSYSATKAFQNTYIQALEQLANSRRLKIRFTDIRPGFVDTDLLSGDFRYPMMLRPESVALDIVKAIHRKKHIAVIDWRYRILTAIWRRIPRFVWRRLRLV